MSENLQKFSLKDKWALITGASKGIGRSTAICMAEAGANVIAVARSEELLKTLRDEIRMMKRECEIFRCDVSSEKEIKDVVEEAWKLTGGIDFLINNAGITYISTAEEFPTEEWKKVLDVNVNGAFYFSREWGKRAIARGKGGSIVNIASVLGIVATKFVIPYEASKGALISLTRGLACEWAYYKIRVNCVAPGWVETEMSRVVWENPETYQKYLKGIPLRRWAKPEDIGWVVVFLCSPAASYITGQTIIVDGGLTIL
uniref:Gluconate 5-dehydrogenase n=1 Tax=uncultured prokaryote TaxID=198431 RepID=H5SPX7_9ZZZZ|nr:gluconate 5-dehydrogenase [uncultured prokaryote]